MLNHAISDFREAWDFLERYKAEHFPRGTIVMYHNTYCIVVCDGQCPADRIALRFENGNDWWKPLDEVLAVTDLATVPPWVRRMKLAWAGMPAMKL